MTGPARAAWDKASTQGTRPAGELELVAAANRALREQEGEISRLRAGLTEAQCQRLHSTDRLAEMNGRLQAEVSRLRAGLGDRGEMSRD